MIAQRLAYGGLDTGCRGPLSAWQRRFAHAQGMLRDRVLPEPLRGTVLAYLPDNGRSPGLASSAQPVRDRLAETVALGSAYRSRPPYDPAATTYAGNDALFAIRPLYGSG
jgi:hypothetical protein